MTAWRQLNEFLESHVLPEERMYRGESDVRMKDIEALFDKISKGDPETGQPYSDDPRVFQPPSPEGGSVTAAFPVDPRVWGRWARTPDMAAIFSTTKDDPYPGAPRGGTVMKRAHGGRVFYQPGKGSAGHERMPSAVDRYDVMMVGDVQGAPLPTKGLTTSQGLGKAASIVVQRIAWSPAIGSTEERQARLRALLGGGGAGPLRRRPQAQVPTVTKDPTKRPPESDDPYWDEKVKASVPDAPRQGTAGRMGLGHKQRDTYKKRDDEDED